MQLLGESQIGDLDLIFVRLEQLELPLHGILSCHVGIQFLFRLQIRILEQYIVAFEIPVYDVLRVKIPHPIHYLLDDVASLTLLKPLLKIKQLLQRTTVAKFQD